MGQLDVFLFDVEPEDMVKMFVREYIVGKLLLLLLLPYCMGYRGRDICYMYRCIEHMR
jgi:hypothetical protein